MSNKESNGGVAWRLTKEKTLFYSGLAVGAAGLFHEVVILPSPRPWLTMIFVGMMGFTSLLKVDSILKHMGIKVTLAKPEDTPAEDGSAP